jgi:hypothetical protein
MAVAYLVRLYSGRLLHGAILVVLWAALFVVSGSMRAAPVEGQPSEYEVKGAYLLNFAKFVKWPQQKLNDADSPFTVGVVGDEAFAASIDSVVHGKKLNGHKVVVRRVANADDARKSHLLFVSRAEEGRLAAIVAEVRDEPVLTVGESDRFISRGGMINFIPVGDTIRFEINRTAAEKVGLKIDSRLLSLAKIADAG